MHESDYSIILPMSKVELARVGALLLGGRWLLAGFAILSDKLQRVHGASDIVTPYVVSSAAVAIASGWFPVRDCRQRPGVKV